VVIDLHITHPRIADLRVSLINPSSTEAVVFSGERDGTELYLNSLPLRGFPGDESANGVWTLKVVDTRRGQTGTIQSFGLTLTSRWD
jgi:subtilisin-like proprotein convertase family protein